jgi:hypothetical protein
MHELCCESVRLWSSCEMYHFLFESHITSGPHTRVSSESTGVCLGVGKPAWQAPAKYSFSYLQQGLLLVWQL